MNIRKPVDYSVMYAALDALMAANLPQMELYCEIGRLVSGRAEKGAAVAAAEYFGSTYPDTSGFSPRNLRRMREFYRAYEDAPEVLAQAMTIGWTQNVVILEADLTLQERVWYIRAVGKFGWSKLELQRRIAANAHLENALDFQDEVCYTDGKASEAERESNDKDTLYLTQEYLWKPHSRIRDERFGNQDRTGISISHRVRGYQHRGDWQFGLSPGAAQAGQARDRLPGSCRQVASGRRLWEVRPPD